MDIREANDILWHLDSARKDIETLLTRSEGQSNYSISLQRAIEYHCRGKEVPEVIAKDCPHHAKMLNARILESQATS